MENEVEVEVTIPPTVTGSDPVTVAAGEAIATADNAADDAVDASYEAREAIATAEAAADQAADADAVAMSAEAQAATALEVATRTEAAVAELLTVQAAILAELQREPEPEPEPASPPEQDPEPKPRHWLSRDAVKRGK